MAAADGRAASAHRGGQHVDPGAPGADASIRSSAPTGDIVAATAGASDPTAVSARAAEATAGTSRCDSNWPPDA